MKIVFSLLVVALSFSTQVSTSRAQGVGPVDMEKTVVSDHSSKTKADQPEKKDEPQSQNEDVKGEADKASLSSNTSAPALNPTAGNNTTTDAPARTTPNVPAIVPPTAAPTAKEAPKEKNLSAPASPNPSANPTPLAPTELYKVGVGDVLDIHLLNAPTQESTLYTIMPGGLLEYPLAGEPVQVSGLTTGEISALLKGKIKILDDPQLAVNVRDYASHNVMITGLVDSPGTRTLRREAVPLYVLLAEVQPRPEAARATIMRTGAQSITVDLSDTTSTSTLVQPGDVIKFSAAPPPAPQFYFIGGQINSPGQKDFHAGLTLTQAILASGGTTGNANSKVKVSRQGADGRLVTTEFNLKEIEAGRIPDPGLQAGDRIEVGRGRW